MYYVKYATLESNRGPEQLRYRSRGPDLVPAAVGVVANQDALLASDRFLLVVFMNEL